MKDKKALFVKSNIQNRFIAVKYCQLPSDTRTSYIVKPQSDGLGFIVNLSGLEALEKNPEVIFYIKERIIRLNKIIGDEYCSQKKLELGLKASKNSDDRLTIFACVFCFVGFLCTYLSLNTDSLKWMMLASLGLYVLVIGVVIKIIISATLIQPTKQKDIITAVIMSLDRELNDMNMYLREHNWYVSTQKEMFWLKFERLQ